MTYKEKVRLKKRLNYYGLMCMSGMPLGYQELGTLIALHDNTPNTTLPIIFDLQEGGEVTLYPFEPFTRNNKPLEDPHIIPRDWINNNLSSEMDYVDSCLNRVYISFEANRGMNGIFAQNPHQYLTEISIETIRSLLIPEI